MHLQIEYKYDVQWWNGQQNISTLSAWNMGSNVIIVFAIVIFATALNICYAQVCYTYIVMHAQTAVNCLYLKFF